MEVQLVSVPTNYGRGANEGAYYPVGLLTIASYLKQMQPGIGVSIVDLEHQPDFKPSADVVGISASSALNYLNVLRVAEMAKCVGATVVLGGSHVTQLAEQVLKNRSNLIDYVIRGYGEVAFSSLLCAIRTGDDMNSVPNLSWRASFGNVVHNPLSSGSWSYEDFLPLDFSSIQSDIKAYWRTFNECIDRTVDAAFVVFTHFGCSYRETMQQRIGRGPGLTKWCSYCSLNEPLLIRSGEAIVNEVLGLCRISQVPTGSRVLLKCYGDNVGSHRTMLRELASAINCNNDWNNFDIGWTFYVQSSRLSSDVANLLRQVGTRNVYIGFDSADDAIQNWNGLGTSLRTHRRAVRLCSERDIKIQAGFVLGCAGETQVSLENTLRFAKELASQRVLERINSAVLFVAPGAPAYSLLCKREPWIRELDDLPVEELQYHWVRHFCPKLGKNPIEGLDILRQTANRLDELSPGPHASMGFVSDRLMSTKNEIGFHNEYANIN